MIYIIKKISRSHKKNGIFRIKHRWEAIDQENQEIQQAKNKNWSYTSVYLDNVDTRKQLLARSRFLLFKSPGDWTPKQTERATILFQLYPDIKKASKIVQQLRNIYNQTTDVRVAYTKLAHWYKLVEDSGFKAFNIVAKSIALNYESILNYFINRSTNHLQNHLMRKLKHSEHSLEE